MIEVTVSNQQLAHPVKTDEVSAFVVKVAEALECTADEVSVAFVEEDRIRRYNRDYRGIDLVTDVLSFALDLGAGLDGAVNLGDLVICPARAAEQAGQAGHSFWREVRILLLHGFLHLLGMDHPEHADEEGESEMERTERRLRRLLIDD